MTATTAGSPDAAAKSRRTRGPSASTPARRAEIIRAASASIAEHGYERASLRDIAARANVTHAALLRHFASKDELLLAALARRDEDDEELARRIMGSKVPAEQVLSTVLREEFTHPDQQRNWLAIAVAATNPDHPAHDFFIARRERLRAHLSSGRLGTTHDSEELTCRREGHHGHGDDGRPADSGPPRPDTTDTAAARDVHATHRHARPLLTGRGSDRDRQDDRTASLPARPRLPDASALRGVSRMGPVCRADAPEVVDRRRHLVLFGGVRAVAGLQFQDDVAGIARGIHRVEARRRSRRALRR